MMSVVNLDPASLSLWFDPTFVTRGSGNQEVQRIVQTAALLHPSDVTTLLEEVNDPEVFNRCAQLASSVWHEKRHFLDLILTNYGAFRVRQFFQLYVNMSTLIQEKMRSGQRLFCPLDVYLDPVRCEVLHVGEGTDNLKAVARDMAQRKNILAEDRQALKTKWGTVEFGGEAQLEALAFVTQLAASQTFFGFDGARNSMTALKKNQWSNLKYRWLELLMIEANLVQTTRLDEDTQIVDSTMMMPLVYGSLMLRGWGQPQTHTPDGVPHLPLYRLILLMKYFEGKSFGFWSLLVEDAWAQVNDAAKEMWGRSVYEELAADYAKESEWCEKIYASSWVIDYVKEAIIDFHELRGTLIKMLKDSPLSILETSEFCSNLLPKLQPIFVLASPDGQYGEMLEGWEPVYKYNHPDRNAPDSKWWWATAYTDAPQWEDAIGFKKVKNWLEIIRENAPIAKLLLNGRRHKTMLGPELIHVQATLSRLGIEVKFDPLFEFPREDYRDPSYYVLSGNSHAICDLCKKSIEQSDSYCLSPWVFRKSPHHANFCIQAYGGGETGYMKFLKDWSPWIVCSECYTLLSARIKI